MDNNPTGATASAADLLDAAKGDFLSDAGYAALNLHDLGQTIQAGLGVSVDDVAVTEGIFLFIVLDDSSSIENMGNTAVVRDGVNLILDSLADSKQASTIFAYCIQMNRGVTYPLTPLIDPKTDKIDARLKITSANYRPSGTTPLFDTTLAALGTAVAKAQEFAQAGVPVRTATVIVTDGDNVGGNKQHPESCKPVLDDLLRQETHIVAFMGIDDGSTNFRDVAARMGVRQKWILTPKDDPTEIRRAFAMVSQSMVRASQAKSAADLAKVSAGGFGG